MLSVNNIYFIFVNWLDTVNNVEWKDKYNGASRRLYNFDVMKYLVFIQRKKLTGFAFEIGTDPDPQHCRK